MSQDADLQESAKRDLAAALAKADHACVFGPSFFLGHLGRFVRDHCPGPEEQLPFVEIRLLDGRTLDLCHIVGVSARWVMFAVRDPSTRPGDMAIDIVPFEMIQGVRIRPRHTGGGAVGFSQVHSPSVMTAETLAQGALVSPRERPERQDLMASCRT